MKLTFLLIITLITSISYSAIRNPQIRTCQSLGGEYLVANSFNDQIGLCKFDQSYIGALDLLLFNNKESIVSALKFYLKGQTNCESVGQIQTLIILQGESLQFCSFKDGSFIELGTMIKGQDSEDNKKLNDILGLLN